MMKQRRLNKLIIIHIRANALHSHSVKRIQIRLFFWSVFSLIQPEYGKIRTRKNSVFGHFSHSE